MGKVDKNIKFVILLVSLLLTSCTVSKVNVDSNLMEEMRKSVKDGFGVEMIG